MRVKIDVHPATPTFGGVSRSRVSALRDYTSASRAAGRAPFMRAALAINSFAQAGGVDYAGPTLAFGVDVASKVAGRTAVRLDKLGVQRADYFVGSYRGIRSS